MPPEDTQEQKPGMGAVDLEARLQELERQLAATKAQLHDVNQESAARRLALRKTQEERDALEQQHLAEQGKWKELAERRQAQLDILSDYQEKYQAVQQAMQAANAKRIAQIPEGWRSAVPTAYTPEQMSQWLDENLPLLTTPKAPDLDAGVKSSGGTQVVKLSDEDLAWAKKLKLSPEQYAQHKERPKFQEHDD
jgi:Skp family chaperone for outer membrane proteins